MIKNYMEILVDEVFNEVKPLLENCDINKCSHDIKSMALNNLPTKYFDFNASEAEKKAFLLDRQRRITVLAKMAEAIEYVCSSCNLNNK